MKLICLVLKNQLKELNEWFVPGFDGGGPK